MASHIAKAVKHIKTGNALRRSAFGTAPSRRDLSPKAGADRVDALRPGLDAKGKALRIGFIALALGVAGIAHEIALGAGSLSEGWASVAVSVAALFLLHRAVFRATLAVLDIPLLKGQTPYKQTGSARKATLVALASASGALALLDMVIQAGQFNALLDFSRAAWWASAAWSVGGAIFAALKYTKAFEVFYGLLSEYGIESAAWVPGVDDDEVLDVRLSSGFAERDQPNLQKYAEEQGCTVTDYDLVGSVRTAELTPVTPEERKIYEDAARNLNKPVWEFTLAYEWVENEEDDRDQVPIRLESLSFRRYPIIGLSPQDREKYFRAVIAGLPKASDGWTITDDQDDPVKVLHYGKPLRFDGDLLYDIDAPTSYEAIPFARDLNGGLVTLSLIESNMLLGGVPGGGKSGGLTAIIAGCARLPNVALVGLDPKKVEQAMWLPRFTHIATTLDDALATLNALTAEMDRRYDVLVAAKKKKISASMVRTDLPLIVVVADEMAELVAMGITKDDKAADTERVSEIQRLIQKGRAAGIVFVGATQKPAAEVIPTRLRDLVQQRVAYATTNSFMTDTILGTGMASNGGLAHEIEHDQKGVCFVVNESSRTPVMARTLWIPDEDVAEIAEATAHLRVPLEFLESPDDPPTALEVDSPHEPRPRTDIFDRFRD